MVDKLMHWNAISSIKSDNLTPYYTTTDNNQVIEFKTSDGVQRSVNALTIWTNSTALYIQLGDSTDCIYIPANSSVSLDYLLIKKITVLANAGVNLRYIAMYY